MEAEKASDLLLDFNVMIQPTHCMHRNAGKKGSERFWAAVYESDDDEEKDQTRRQQTNRKLRTLLVNHWSALLHCRSLLFLLFVDRFWFVDSKRDKSIKKQGRKRGRDSPHKKKRRKKISIHFTPSIKKEELPTMSIALLPLKILLVAIDLAVSHHQTNEHVI